MNWKLETKNISDVKPYDNNPRRITGKGMKDLKKSIGKFGLAEPIVINTDGTIIGGHARYLALKEQGVKEFDCYIPDRELTEDELKELNVRLNKNIAGEFDLDILANHFDLDDLLDWGFEEKELDINLWKDEIPEEKLDEVPEVQKEAISKLGDLFVIDGKHRVMCGDSTKREDVEILMDGGKADICQTDPPYGMDAVKNSGVLKERYRNIKNDDSIDVAVKSFLIAEKLSQNIIYWGANYYANSLPNSACWIVWDKNNGQSDQMDCELAWTNLKGVVRKYTKASEKKNRVHPTQKPVSLVIWCFDRFNIVIKTALDLFLGSGSTLIACEQTNRICYGMELDPIYIDVILRRYHNLYPNNKVECLNREFNFNELWQDQENK